MSYDYSENILVQESTGRLLQEELGWEVAMAYNTEKLGEDGTFGRKNYREILLTRYLQAAIRKLNPWITDDLVDEAIRTLDTHLSTSSLLQINEEKYNLIRDGIPVTLRKPDGKSEEKRVAVIDFQRPENNHFLAIKELKVWGELYRRRTDVVGFVNGIPLLFIELKKNTVDVQNAYTDNYTDYLDTIPHLFHYNAMVMLSNGGEAKVGTLGSKYEFFHEWKRLHETDAGNVALATLLRGICKKDNFLDLVENFILYDHSEGRTVKILARNHQYLGVNEAVKAYETRQLNNGKLGVFWHTQGSGKSYSMLFLAQKIRRKCFGSPTIVILTDREELNTQISDTFENCGMLGKTKASRFIATSGTDLVNKLQGNQSFIFTLIQKFNQPVVHPITPKHDLLIMSDEAHRSQYGIFADNMCQLLPTASRIGFTGTPLLTSDNITERTFGGYVSVYDFQRAVEDGATVPLYYENRGDKIGLAGITALNERMIEAIEAADLDPNQQEKLEREFAKEIHVLTAEPRLRVIAQDFVRHYSDLWTSGKAMFVCLNKVTCVWMFNFVQEYWTQEIVSLKEQQKHASQQESLEMERKIRWMEETEMAVVISQEQNEILTFNKWGLDIIPHRTKMEKREMDKEFKKSESPFRIVFVCAMWLTGFDVKSLSCLYLDKPLKAHSLMQAIARANRVNEGKSNGLVIDYIGIVSALKKALADYTGTRGGGGDDPTVDKEKLLSRIAELVEKIRDFLKEHGFILENLVKSIPDSFDRLELIQQAANAMCGTLEIKKTFQTYANELFRLMKYVNRDDVDDETRANKNAIKAIYDELQKKRKHADTTGLMVEINKIVNEYIIVHQSRPDDTKPDKTIDISQIDFERLSREFAKAKKRNLAMKDLEELVEYYLEQMMVNNPGRVNYYERYQAIIDEYNQDQDKANIERTFEELMKLASDLNTEQQRYVREGFDNEEELALFDMLFSDTLSPKDIKIIKMVSKDLLVSVKEKITALDHWTDKSNTTAEISNLIRDTLWKNLPEVYTDTSIDTYRQHIFEYFYSRYKEVV